MASSAVETIVRLQGSRQFQQAATASAKAIGSIGVESERSEAKAKSAWRGIAKWAGGTAALYSAGRFLKSAVSTTEDLAKSTMTLQRATGLDAPIASSWAEILKVRGIDARQFQTGLTKLSKTIEAARAGNKKSAAMFDALGVDRAAIASGNVNAVVMQTADAYAAMTNPAAKAATAQALFGKSGQALAPLLSGGSKGIGDQLALTEKYGATIGDTTGPREMLARQREMRIAMDGLKIQLGTKLMPALLAFAGLTLKVVRTMSPVLKNSTAVYIAIGLLSAAFVAAKVQALAAGVAFVRSNMTLLLILAAITALVVGFTWLCQKWSWVRDLVSGTWSWVRDHWQALAAILLGPIGVAIVLLVRNFGRIKAAASSAFAWISTTARRIGTFLSDVFSVDFLAGLKRGIADWLNLHTPLGDTVDLAFAGSIRIPALASGGTMRSAGAALVGEEGPEVVTPAGFTVPNVERIPKPRVPPILAQRYGTRPHATITQEVHLSRRELHDAAANNVTDRQARR